MRNAIYRCRRSAHYGGLLEAVVEARALEATVAVMLASL